MKAAVIHEFGDVDVLKHEDIERPRPKPGHVLIKVLAAGVERLDHYIREGSIVPELPFPHILGADAAGEVADQGVRLSLISPLRYSDIWLTRTTLAPKGHLQAATPRRSPRRGRLRKQALPSPTAIAIARRRSPQHYAQILSQNALFHLL